MYRFALRPRWIAGHLVALVAVAVFINMALWQMRRLDERRDRNAAVEAAAQLDPSPLAELSDDPEANEWRPVRLEGRFLDAEAHVRSRSSQAGVIGYHVLTPFETAAGTVLVNRGWIPVEEGRDESLRWDAPSGTVTLAGRLRPPSDARVALSEGAVPTVSNIDPAAVSTALGIELEPYFVELVEPAPALYPEPVPEPELGDGPHLSYAGQWTIFALVVIVVYPLILRRAARTDGEDELIDDTSLVDDPD